MITISKIRRPGIGGIFDFDMFPEPKLPPFDFSPVLPLDAGSPGGGGADGGGEPAPAPSPGEATDFPVFEVPVPGYIPPQYTYPVQELPPPIVTEPAPAIPTWALVGGAALAGIAVTALLMGKKG